jgi:ubiquinone/menaquinone biosynthesis C-methylase UbiE
MASVFDELPFWSSRFGALLFDHLQLRPHLHILDLGCGAGFPLFELAHAHGDSCRLTGMDIWKAALHRARAKLRVYDLPNVGIVAADGARMPFRDGEFDLIVSNLGINNFSEPPAVFSECFRVAKPGARIALTTNLKGHMREFYEVFKETLRDLRNPEYLERLNANEGHRGTKESVRGLLEGSGFVVTRVIEESFHLRYLDGSALLNHSLTKFGFLDGWRAVVGPGDEREIFQKVEKRLNEIAARNSELVMTIPALYVEGEKLAPENGNAYNRRQTDEG